MNDPFRAVTPHPDEARKQLRTLAVARREALDAGTRAALQHRIEAHLETLCTQLAPKVLAFCWPWRGEVDLRAWAARWLAAGTARAVALPAVLERGQPLVFRRWTPGTPMALDRHGLPYPETGGALLPDVVLVPLNAFDAQGYRLGYGGGYFDRTLAVLPAVAVGVGFELGRAVSVLPQPHDRPMDWLVTEEGVFRPAPDQPRNSR